MTVHFVQFATQLQLLRGIACKGQIIKKIQSLTIELFKYKGDLLNTIMCNIFKTGMLTDNLRSQTDFMRDCVNTRRYGLNSLRYFAPDVWDMVSSEIQSLSFLQKFMTEIQKQVPENCSCYLCRPYIQNFGFIDFV